MSGTQQDSQPKTLRTLLRQLDEQGVTDYRRYDAVRKFLSFKARDKGIPISGSFELTPLCNLDCRMCYVHLNKEQMAGTQLLTVEQWKAIMQQAIDAGMMYARLTGGECLTYPGFRELYTYLHSKGVETAILSNGLLMDADMVDFLVAHPPAAVQITLYGASEEGYERVTGKRAFRQVLENIRRLDAAGIPLQIAVTPNEFMTDGEGVIRLLHEEGLSFAINAGLMAPREETGRKLADAALDAYVAMLKLRMRLKGRQIEPDCDPESLPDPGSERASAERAYAAARAEADSPLTGRAGCVPATPSPVSRWMCLLWASPRPGSAPTIRQITTPCLPSAKAVPTRAYASTVWRSIPPARQQGMPAPPSVRGEREWFPRACRCCSSPNDTCDSH